ncbi:hypothetical protein R6Z07F_001407 [Ovis aries]
MGECLLPEWEPLLEMLYSSSKLLGPWIRFETSETSWPFSGPCSGRRRRLPHCYCQEEVEIQILHATSTDTQGTNQIPICRESEKKESEVIQLCPTLCDPMDCSLPGSSIHGIFQARILECVAISFSRRPS